MAYGCPLTAAIVTDYYENGSSKGGVCRFHHGAQPEDFQEITQRLRSDQIRPLARAVIRMQQLCAVEIKSLPIRRFAGIDETEPKPGETNFQWAERMGHLLHAMVTDGLSEKGGSDMEPEVARGRFHAQMANIADQILTQA
jgi:hypothetical protein